MNNRDRSIVGLLVGQGWAKADAVAHCKGLSEDDRAALCARLVLEAKGQSVLPIAPVEPVRAVRPKKVSYSLLLPPDLLEAVKDAAERDGSSASQFIRTAIAKQLGRVK